MLPSNFFRAFLFATLCGAAAAARALDPRIPLDHLHHDMWTSKDGMPGDVWDMAQGAGGTMWFAATSGLYRFDGVRFEHVRSLGGTALQSNVLSALRAHADGALWIGYRFGGADVWHGGVLRHYGTADGLPAGGVRGFERDRAGRDWVLTTKGLLRLDGGRWVRAEDGLPGPAQDLWRAPDGALLAAGDGAVFRLDDATQRFVATGIAATGYGLLLSPDGQLWNDANDRIRRVPAALAAYPAGRPHAGLPTAFSHIFDRDGNLWAALAGGVARTTPAGLADKETVMVADGERLARPDSLSSTTVKTILEDGEGNIWLGTRRGVDRLRHNRLMPLPLAPDSGYITLAHDGAGTLWATAKVGPLWQFWRLDAGGPVLQPDQRVTALATGNDGSLLVGTGTHIERRANGKTERIPFPANLQHRGDRYEGARLMVDDGAALWASFVNDRLYRYADGAWRPATDFGLPERPPNGVGRARDGTLWIGYDNDIHALRDGKLRRYGRPDGLDIGLVATLADVGGTLVAGGDRGLALLSGTRFRQVEAADPGAFAGVTGIVQTPDGDLWLNGSRGLVHVRGADWSALLAAPARTRLPCEVFDTLDGYPGIAHFRTAQPSLLQDRQGRLLLAATDGAAWLDPRRLYRNLVAPPLRIGAVGAHGQAFAPRDGMLLPAGTRALQIDYDAASFTMPERVRFRYRLEGVDADWQDAGTRRSAYYSRLAPGDYRFRVQAVNEDGVWSERGAALSFGIAPTFVQSTAFKVLCAAAAAFAAWLLYRLRLRAATRQLRRLLRERAGERERIARTLHDTLMQSVQALLMLFETARDRLPADNPSRPLLDRTLEQARRTLAEGRDELYALRGAGAPGQDLAAALAPLGHMLGEQYGVGFDIAVDGAQRALRPEVAQEACFIAREALQNAFRHTHAAHVTLRLRYDDTEFALEVRDDGRGLAPGPVRPGHWGLAGMRERAAAIGAGIAIGAAGPPGSGTLVALRLDARLAYAAPPRRRRPPGFSLFRGAR